MKISELMEELGVIQGAYGDIHVNINSSAGEYDDHPIGRVALVAVNECEPVVILCDKYTLEWQMA